MSLSIIKAGILSTIQDGGRYGYQHQGINPTGAMDQFSSKLSNCLLGKDLNAPVIELHFPAPTFQFNVATIFAITGANFTPAIDNKKIPLNHPIAVNKNTTLQFKKAVSGARCYLSIFENLHLNAWLGSFSTNLKAEAGGFNGSVLRKDDVISFEKKYKLSHLLNEKNFVVLPWFAQSNRETLTDKIEVIEGKEWHLLSQKSKIEFEETSFTISTSADRMGYRLKGNQLHLEEEKQLVSAGVTFGTVQLLPNGQLIILMADHQTTGGYPVIANVISAHLPLLAQLKPNEILSFKRTDVGKAEQKLLAQHKYLQSVKHAASFKINDLFT